MDDGATLLDYLSVILVKWWIIVVMVVVSVVVAWVLSLQRPPQYQVRTQLLLVSRTSEILSGSAAVPSVTVALSVDTLSKLALANDLLENIAKSPDLATSGGSLTAASLSQMMHVDIKVSENSSRTVLPLLTMTVTGGDPALLKKIADTWANLFIQRNVSLLASESARSYDFIQSQYQETKDSLAALNKQKSDFLRQSQLDTTRSTLEEQQSLYKQFFSNFETSKVSLITTQAERQALADALANEPRILSDSKIFVDGVVVEKAINPIYTSLKGRLDDAAVREASLTASVTELEKKVQEYNKSIADLSGKVGDAQAQAAALDAEISALAANLQVLGSKLQDARLAKEEQAGSIRVVESAILPTAPIGTSRQQFLLPAAVIGLLVGIAVALLVYYVQEGNLRAKPKRRGAS